MIVSNWKVSRLPYGSYVSVRQRFYPDIELLVEDIVLETKLELEQPERIPRRW
jgi:hypothetical protein